MEQRKAVSGFVPCCLLLAVSAEVSTLLPNTLSLFKAVFVADTLCQVNRDTGPCHAEFKLFVCAHRFPSHLHEEQIKQRQIFILITRWQISRCLLHYYWNSLPPFSPDISIVLQGLTKLGHYNGSVSHTDAGSPCLKWTNFPDYMQQYPNRGLGDHNFCRNPDRETKPWCFFRKTSGAIGWAYCDCHQGELRVGSRLVGGLEEFEGRVEVYHNGRWGTICDDQWDDLDAEVVCRQLGLGGVAKAWTRAHFGQGFGPVLLARVQCTGNELSLEDCPHSNWEQHNCEHMDDAGVSCNPYTDGAVRLVGATSDREGRVEIYYQGQWGTVCDDSWTELNAQVVCRQLGFRSKVYEEGNGLIQLDEVQCDGTETTLLACTHSQWRQHDCSHSEDVGVLSFRCGSNHTLREGRVEVFVNGQWGSVCDDGWNDVNAAVVCRQLGFTGVAKARSMAYFGEGQGPIHLDNVRCSGTETSLGQCPAEGQEGHDCRHSEDAGVICDYTLDPTGTGASAMQSCGRRLSRQRRQRRIIGGEKSLRGEWPWQVSLWLRSQSKGNHPLCGASLINSCWLVTAAHCFKRFGRDPARYVLRLGDYHTVEQDDFERTLSPERIIIHTKYHSQSWEYDIALLRLKGTEGNCVAFNPHTGAVCLPEPGDKLEKRLTACVITGWGITGKFHEYSHTLLQAWVPLLPALTCKKRYGNRFTSRMLCAGSLSKHHRVDSCQGDSGGPLVCQGERGHWVLTGVISWGHGCGNPSFPGVYTRVSRFLRWINKAINKPYKNQ
uniref:Neurotrypsin n=1 Tax=Pundamilia nyererei TaxID=303518 RepID=A0A3B4FMH6_9CICH